MPGNVQGTAHAPSCGSQPCLATTAQATGTPVRGSPRLHPQLLGAEPSAAAMLLLPGKRPGQPSHLNRSGVKNLTPPDQVGHSHQHKGTFSCTDRLNLAWRQFTLTDRPQLPHPMSSGHCCRNQQERWTQSPGLSRCWMALNVGTSLNTVGALSVLPSHTSLRLCLQKHPFPHLAQPPPLRTAPHPWSFVPEGGTWALWMSASSPYCWEQM